MRRIIAGDLITVVATIGAATLATSALQPVLPLYLTSIGISPTILGFMLSTAMVGMVLGESTGSWLADKLGIKIPLSIGTFFCTPVVFCFVLTRDIPVIFLI
jgi:MFS family permease